MVKATFTMQDGRGGLILGLSEGNLQRLRAGQPIHFDPATVRLDGAIGAIIIHYGKTDDEVARALDGLIGSHTEFIAIPRAPDTEQ